MPRASDKEALGRASRDRGATGYQYPVARTGRDGKTRVLPSAGRVSQERVEEPEYPTEEEIWLANAFYHWSHCYENYRKLSPAAKAEFESNREPWSEK